MSILLTPNAPPLGLGCSRLGSIGGVPPDAARILLRAAVDAGVRLFDTSNIYGQGDSERLLGEALAGSDDAIIISKAGKYISWPRRIALPLKGVLRASTKGSTNAKQRVAAIRANPMPTRWDSRFLTKSLEASLRRLNREQVDVFLLHSPSVEVIRTGEAVGALEEAKIAGKVGTVGVSVDDPATALACLTDGRIRVLQVPLPPGQRDYDVVLEKAAESGVSVVAREILGGANGIAAQTDPSGSARARIIEVVRNPRIAVPLVGSNRLETLAKSIEAAVAATRLDPGTARPFDGGPVGG